MIRFLVAIAIYCVTPIPSIASNIQIPAKVEPGRLSDQLPSTNAPDTKLIHQAYYDSSPEVQMFNYCPLNTQLTLLTYDKDVAKQFHIKGIIGIKSP